LLAPLASPAGICARRRSNFLLRRQKKVTKEKAAEVVAPCALLRGTLRCSVCAGSCSNSAYGPKQSQALIRPALRYSPTPHGVGADSQTASPAAPGIAHSANNIPRSP